MRPDVRPNFHFLIVAPNLGAEWLFSAARSYWDAFRPTILPDFDFLLIIPPTRTIIVTAIAQRDTIAQIGVELARTSPLAYLDSLVFDTQEALQAELDRRVSQGQPFGVAISTPTPTLDPNAINLPAIPTPRLPPTRPPSGFVTSTPSPGGPPPPSPQPGTPSPSSTPNPNEPQPIQRTPGPLTGGS